MVAVCTVAVGAELAGWAERVCAACQYCITIAMLAAPQPFFSCLKKGTSIHTPGSCARQSVPQRPNIRLSLRGTRFMEQLLANGNDDQHDHGDSDDNPDQIPITEGARSEIDLGFVRAGSKLRQILIVQG